MKKRNLIVLLVVFVSIVFSNTVFADWVKVGEKWTYEENGALAKSTWKLLKRGNDYSSYYFDEDGYMVTGVWKIGNEYYSFKNDGIANSKSVVVIDGEKYTTGNKGLIEEYPSECFQDNFKGSWQTVGTNYQYLINGIPLVSTWRLIYSYDALSWFYFDESGIMVTGLKRLPDNNYYYFDEQGAAVGNSTVKLHEYGVVETEKKGQLTSLPNGFDLNAYLQESKVAAEVESSIAESRKIQAEQQAVVAAEEAEKRKAEEQERLAQQKAQQELEKATKDALKVTLLSTEEGVFSLVGEENNVMVSYKVPILKGANAAQLNGAISIHLKDIIYAEAESRVDLGEKTKSNIKLNKVSISQDIANHLIKIYYSGDFSLLIYLDTNSLNMWADH